MQEIKDRIQQFWTRYPCAKNIIERKQIDKDFFLMHDRIIDRLTPYHYKVYNYESCKGKVVLEIGCGMGAHAWHFASFAEKYYAVDLSPMSIELTNRRLELYGIKNAQVRQGDAENLDFPDNFFDRVYSNGVIHHTPDTPKVVREIYRVLKPDGQATVMIYNKNSLFYWFNLMMLGWIKYSVLKCIPEQIINVVFKWRQSVCGLKKDLDNICWSGLPDLILRFSDGHFNPHTKVYTRKGGARLFSQFQVVKIELRSPSNHYLEKISFLSKHCGWALFIHAKK
jgi:ubiquinone/menaquinone biosynthesis C-methylase UbiE